MWTEQRRECWKVGWKISGRMQEGQEKSKSRLMKRGWSKKRSFRAWYPHDLLGKPEKEDGKKTFTKY